jgi:hypothetical protein
MSYEIEKCDHGPAEWIDYEALLLKEWGNLLNSVPAPSENIVHTFLEQHPCMLPGAQGMLSRPSADYPFFCAAISQPVLPSYEHRTPDFMWIAGDSATNYPVLIEIEAPTKKWFVQSGKQSEELTQALDQLAEWKTWFSKAHNVAAFKEYYRLPEGFSRGRALKPLYILIYGRRDDANQKEHLAEKRPYLTGGEDTFVMTYDRLAPDRNSDQMMCIRRNREDYHAISIPPTIKLTPRMARCRSIIAAKAEAVKASPYIAPERKEFLIRRFEYWDTWAKTKEFGPINMGDWE